MFDTDARKDLRRKYKHATVLDDLKLTETLSNDLETVRNKVSQLQDQLDQSLSDRNSLKKQLKQSQCRVKSQAKEIGLLRDKLRNSNYLLQKFENQNAFAQLQTIQLQQLCLVSEQLRTKFSRAMHKQKLMLEKETHAHFCLQTQQQLVTHQLHYLFQKYALLFASTQFLAYDKSKQDVAAFAQEQSTEKSSRQCEQI